MGDVAIVSANFARYDYVRAQAEQDMDVEWFMFTDEAMDAPEPWRVVVEDGRGPHPNLAAKRFKLLPPVPHRFVVWIDASIQVTSPSFAREALACINDGIALHTHPYRDCIYKEAAVSFGPKYDGQPVQEQVAHYREEGFPCNAGLYACGAMAWDRKDPRAKQLGRAWMDECVRWTFQDQLAFPVLCQRLGIKPGTFPHDVYESPWFTIAEHRHKQEQHEARRRMWRAQREASEGEAQP